MKKIDRILQDGLAFHQRGMLADAERLYAKARQIAPAHPDVLHLLGLVWHQRGRSSEGKELVLRAIQVAGKVGIFWKTLGAILKATGDLKEALDAYNEAQRLDPSDPETYFNRGGVFHHLNRIEEAVADYARALELRPGYRLALANLGIALRDIGLWSEALECLEQAGPDAVAWVKASLRQHLCFWEQYDQDVLTILDAALAGDADPFPLLSIPTHPEQQLAAARKWDSKTMRCGTACVPRSPTREGRIKLGYLSEDFRAHATSELVAEIFELHDRSQFEIFLYSYGPDDKSKMRDRLMNSADHFVDFQGHSNEMAARRIEGDVIDVLVDLKGYVGGTRSALLAARPAPVQVNWLGYPGTMGSKHLDFIVADPFVVPPGAEAFYSEQVIRLPHCYQPNDRKRLAQEPLTREQYGLPAKGFVFCCFTQPYKILPATFDGWMRILKAVPGSVLWLLAYGDAVAENLRSEAQRREVSGDRLIFAPRIPVAQHLARYHVANLALETFPYTSHTTASDAIWMGCPLVTRVGDTFASRVAGSILTAAGLADLVTENQDQYEEMVIELTLDPNQLAALRRRIEDSRLVVPLFDAPTFTRELEEAYRLMLEGTLAGSTPPAR